MKKTLLTIILAFASIINSNAQYNRLTASKDGISNSIQTFKTSLDEKKILNKIETWVNKTYENPSKVISGYGINGKLDNTTTINGFQPNVFCYQQGGQTYPVDINYEIKITIEDSILKLNFNVLSMVGSNNYKIVFGGMLGLFNKDNELRNVYEKCDAKVKLENFINGLLQPLIESMNEAYTSDEAITELKRWKDKLDLGLISQDEFVSKRNELSKFIK